MKTQLAFLCLLLLQALAPAAHADPVTSIPAISLTGLQQYAGRTISVFYVSGVEHMTLLTGQPLQLIRSIKAGPVEAYVDANGHTEVSAIDIPRVAYNFDVVNFVLISAEKDAPSLARDTREDYKALRDAELAHINLIKLQKLENAQGNPRSVQVQFNDLWICRR